MVVIWLRSTTTVTAPDAEGFKPVWVVVGSVKVLPCQPPRKKPCVTEAEGSVPVTILPPGPVPTPVLTVVGVLPPPPPPGLFDESFVHDGIEAMHVMSIAAVMVRFFIFSIVLAPV